MTQIEQIALQWLLSHFARTPVGKAAVNSWPLIRWCAAWLGGINGICLVAGHDRYGWDSAWIGRIVLFNTAAFCILVFGVVEALRGDLAISDAAGKFAPLVRLLEQFGFLPPRGYITPAVLVAHWKVVLAYFALVIGPASCAFVAWAAVGGFLQSLSNDFELPFIFLVLPAGLVAAASATFTGLLYRISGRKVVVFSASLKLLLIFSLSLVAVGLPLVILWLPAILVRAAESVHGDEPTTVDATLVRSDVQTTDSQVQVALPQTLRHQEKSPQPAALLQPLTQTPLPNSDSPSAVPPEANATPSVQDPQMGGGTHVATVQHVDGGYVIKSPEGNPLGFLKLEPGQETVILKHKSGGVIASFPHVAGQIRKIVKIGSTMIVQ